MKITQLSCTVLAVFVLLFGNLCSPRNNATFLQGAVYTLIPQYISLAGCNAARAMPLRQCAQRNFINGVMADIPALYLFGKKIFIKLNQ